MAGEVTYQPGLVDYINMGGGVVLSSFKVMEEAVSVPFFDVEKIKAFAQSNKLKWAGRTLLGVEMGQAGKRLYDYYKDRASFSTEQVAHDWLTLGSNAVGLFLGAVTLKNQAYELALNISRAFDAVDFVTLFENLITDVFDRNTSTPSFYSLAGLAARVGVKAFIKRVPINTRSVSGIFHTEEGFEFGLKGVPTDISPTSTRGCFRSTKIELPELAVNIDGVRPVSIHKATTAARPYRGLTIGSTSSPNPDGSSQLSLRSRFKYQEWVKGSGDSEFRLLTERIYERGEIEIVSRLHLNRNTGPSNGPWFLNAETGAQGRVTLVREDGVSDTISGSLHLDLGVHPKDGPYFVLSKRVDNTPAKSKRKNKTGSENS